MCVCMHMFLCLTELKLVPRHCGQQQLCHSLPIKLLWSLSGDKKRLSLVQSCLSAIKPHRYTDHIIIVRSGSCICSVDYSVNSTLNKLNCMHEDSKEKMVKII